MKKLLLISFSAFMLFVAVTVSAIPNPAVTYCQNMGYTLSGENCLFDDGTSCEQWAFYRGECGQNQVKQLPCKQNGEPVSPGYECCSGLTDIQTSTSINGKCATAVGGWPVCRPCGNNICDEGENSCNCPTDCQNSSITVIYPNGGESWQIGGSYDITWTSTNVANANINLVFNDGYLCPLKTVPASKGHYLFNFLGGMSCPDGRYITSGNGRRTYKIAIIGDTPDIKDYSDNNFYIVQSPDQPTVTITSPNGGENWKVGETHSITWNTTNYAPQGPVGLQICDIRGVGGYTEPVCGELTSPVTNTGSYSWQIPPATITGLSLGDGNYYKIEAYIWPEGMTRWARTDLSDNNFSILKGTTSCPAGCVCKADTFTCPTISQPIQIQVQSSPASPQQAPTTISTETISVGKTSEGKTSIKSENVQAISSEKVKVIDSKVYMETSSNQTEEVKIMPSTALTVAIQKLGEVKNVQIELKKVKKKPAYELKTEKSLKALGIIPVTAQINVNVNAQTGEVLSIKKPWWMMFAW